MNAFSLVFFLLQDKHVVVEKLLQLLIGEVDAKLLKTIELRFIRTIWVTELVHLVNMRFKNKLT